MHAFTYWIAAAVLALLTCTSALGSALHRAAPHFAAKLSPWNGLALARAAWITTRSGFSEESGVLPGRLPETAVLQAAEASAREPLSDTALAVLAYDRLLDGDTASGRELMRSSAQLTKRNEAVRLWLFHDALQRNDEDDALKHLDLIMRSSPASRDLMVPALVNLLERPEFIEPTRALLRPSPPWAGDFWTSAVKNEPALRNATKLRRLLAGDGIGYSGSIDNDLIYRLVKAGQIREARELADALFDLPDEVLVNGDFAAQAQYAPFDWSLPSHSGFGAGINLQAEALVVSAVRDSGGIAASQLLLLEPGDHRFVVVGSGLAGRREPVGGMVLRCAAGGPSRHEVDLDSDREIWDVRIDDQECGGYFLDILARPTRESEGYEFLLDHITLTRR